MNAQLKPCPFCGGEAEIRDERYEGTMASGMETPEPFARCKAGCVRLKRQECDESPYGKDHGARSYKDARAAAVAAWNRRAHDHRDARIAELRALLREVRAEVERLCAENGGGAPDWTCAECGSQDGFDGVRYETGDADMVCRTCGGTDVRESAREAAETLGDKLDTLRGELEVKSNWETVAVAQNEEIERLRGELDYRNEAPDAAALRAEGTTLAKMTRDAVGDEPDAHALAVYGYVSKVDQFLTRLRAAPPSFHLTDIEAAAKAIADGFELYQDQNDTRTTEIIRDLLREHTRPIDREGLARVLYETVERDPDMEYHTWKSLPEYVRPVWFTRADAVLRYLGAQPAQPVGHDPVGAERASLAAIKADAGKRLDAAKESMRAGGYLAAQPVEPKPKPAQLPVCARCGRFACGCEPAKVRVKPPKGYTIKTRGTARDADQIAEQVDAAWIKSLRAQGMEVDDDA